MTPLEIGGLTLFILVLLFGAFSILFGFPGTVIILIDAVVYAAITGFGRIGFKILVTLLKSRTRNVAGTWVLEDGRTDVHARMIADHGIRSSRGRGSGGRL